MHDVLNGAQRADASMVRTFSTAAKCSPISTLTLYRYKSVNLSVVAAKLIFGYTDAIHV